MNFEVRAEKGHWIAELPSWEETLAPTLQLHSFAHSRDEVRIHQPSGPGDTWSCQMIYWNGARTAAHTALLAAALAACLVQRPEGIDGIFRALLIMAAGHLALALCALPGWIRFVRALEQQRALRPVESPSD